MVRWQCLCVGCETRGCARSLIFSVVDLGRLVGGDGPAAVTALETGPCCPASGRPRPYLHYILKIHHCNYFLVLNSTVPSRRSPACGPPWQQPRGAQNGHRHSYCPGSTNKQISYISRNRFADSLLAFTNYEFIMTAPHSRSLSLQNKKLIAEPISYSLSRSLLFGLQQ